jgi:hypothetical protein
MVDLHQIRVQTALFDFGVQIIIELSRINHKLDIR